MELQLDDVNQATELRQLLSQTLSDLSSEIADTDNARVPKGLAEPPGALGGHSESTRDRHQEPGT
jgi:hypothetical protein